MHTSRPIKDEILKIWWFEKCGDKIGEERIVSISKEKIYCLFRLDPRKHNVKEAVQYISKEKAHLLQPYLKHQLDLEKYTYFIGCSS